MTLRTDPPSLRAAPACPVCGKPAESARLMPFCSARCADVDLGRWLTGQYRIAGPPAEDDPNDEAPPDASA
jgi:endogenous inhibitor of DNA gyrase (YacG/DUF329 family)